jgi:hypothetical protein
MARTVVPVSPVHGGALEQKSSLLKVAGEEPSEPVSLINSHIEIRLVS